MKNGYNSRSNSVPNIYQDSASYHHHYQQQQQATYHPPILIPNENSDGGFHYYKEPVSEFSNWNEATIDTYYQIIHPTLPILPTSKIQLKNWLASFESKDLAGALLDALTGLTLKLSQNVIPSQQAFQLKSALLKSSPGNSNNNKSTSGASPSPEDEVLLKTVASHQNNLLQFIWTISSKYGGMMAENLRFNDKCCFMVLLIFLFLYTDDSMWLASAISLGYSLELHHTYTNKNISEIDCRRLFLVLVILDCVNSFSNCNSSRQGLINFPTFIPESVIHFDQVRDATVFNLSSSSSNKNNQERNSSSSTSGGVYIIKLCMVYKHANSARNKLSSFNFASSSTTTFSEVADGNNTGNKTTKEDSLKSCLQLLKSLLKELDLVKMEIEGIWDTTPILKALYYSVLVSVLSTEFSLYQAPRNEEEEEKEDLLSSPSPASSSVTEFYNRSLKFINTLNELITLMASPLISASPLVAYLYKLVAVNMIKLSSVMVTVPARENNSTGHKYWFAFEMSNWNENLQSMSKLSLYSMDSSSNKDKVKILPASSNSTNEESTNKQHEQYLLLSLASNISQTLKYLHHIGVVSICLVIHNEPLKQVIEANEEINRKIELVSSFLQYSSNVTTSISSNNSNNKTPSPRSSAAQLEDENIPSPSTKRKRRSEESTSTTSGNSGGSNTTNNNSAQQNEQRRNKKSKSPHSISHESSEEEIPFPLIVQSTSSSSSTNGTNITKVEDNKSIHHYNNNNNAGSLAVAAASSILSFSKSIHHHHHSSGDDEDYDDENKNNHKTRAPSALESLASIAGNVISS